MRRNSPTNGGIVRRGLEGWQADAPRQAAALRIGTRGSALARWQADWVERALRKACPGLEFVQTIIRTTGDIAANKPLEQLGGRGVFTAEIDRALLDGRIDFAVHSAKDYPTSIPDGLMVAAFPCRAIVNDALVGRHGERLHDLVENALVGTGSLRRSAQIRLLRSDLRFATIRGNIETRLRKLDNGMYDAIVVAEAALRRLGMAERARQVFPVTRVLPDAGQGALMVVCRSGDRRARRMVALINNQAVATCVQAERAVLCALGGGCRLPLGVYANLVGKRIRLRAAVISPDGSRKLTAKADAPASQPLRAVGRAVEHLLQQGAREILDEVERQQP